LKLGEVVKVANNLQRRLLAKKFITGGIVMGQSKKYSENGEMEIGSGMLEPFLIVVFVLFIFFFLI